MRHGRLACALGLAAALAAGAPATEYPTPEETLREQLQALHDLEHAETEEEAREAEERFDAASQQELERRREAIEKLIER